MTGNVASKVLKRSGSADVSFEKFPGRAMHACIDLDLEMEAVHAAALRQQHRPVPSPAEQLAMVRASKQTKRLDYCLRILLELSMCMTSSGSARPKKQ